jgi:hypothetical protein
MECVTEQTACLIQDFVQVVRAQGELPEIGKRGLLTEQGGFAYCDH